MRSCHLLLTGSVRTDLLLIWKNRISLFLNRIEKVCLLANQMSLVINGVPITQVITTKFLGVYVDQHLTWKEHIKNISNKIEKNVGIIARSSYLLPQTIRIKLYYSLIFPYLTYCNVVWASNYESRLSRLVILQKRAILVVARVSSREHTGPIFSRLKILNIEQFKTFQVGEFMYRYHHGLLPLALRGFFKLGTEIHSYFTRNAGAYRRPFACSNTRLFSIKHVGSLMWNKIPPYIELLPNVWIFKKQLRAFVSNGSKYITLYVFFSFFFNVLDKSLVKNIVQPIIQPYWLECNFIEWSYQLSIVFLLGGPS